MVVTAGTRGVTAPAGAGPPSSARGRREFGGSPTSPTVGWSDSSSRTPIWWNPRAATGFRGPSNFWTSATISYQVGVQNCAMYIIRLRLFRVLLQKRGSVDGCRRGAPVRLCGERSSRRVIPVIVLRYGRRKKYFPPSREGESVFLICGSVRTIYAAHEVVRCVDRAAAFYSERLPRTFFKKPRAFKPVSSDPTLIVVRIFFSAGRRRTTADETC